MGFRRENQQAKTCKSLKVIRVRKPGLWLVLIYSGFWIQNRTCFGASSTLGGSPKPSQVIYPGFECPNKVCDLQAFVFCVWSVYYDNLELGWARLYSSNVQGLWMIPLLNDWSPGWNVFSSLGCALEGDYRSLVHSVSQQMTRVPARKCCHDKSQKHWYNRSWIAPSELWAKINLFLGCLRCLKKFFFFS